MGNEGRLGGGPSIDARRWTWRDAAVLAGIAALVALSFWEVIAAGKVFFFRDFALYFYPKRAIVAESIRNFRIPFWESVSACGEPVLGVYETAVFYPAALIYYLMPMPQSFMWFTVLHFFISGAGAYFMMRAWGARRIAAGFTAVAWAFSPAFVSTADYVSFMTSFAWLPWCLGLARRVRTGAGLRGFVPLSVCFAMAVLAGHPESVVFIGVLLSGYAVWTLAASACRRNRPFEWRPAALIFTAMLAGAVLSGVELAPFVNTLGSSARGEPLTMSQAGKWCATPRDFLLLLLPRFQTIPGKGGIHWGDQEWLKTEYLGILVPFLVLWGVIAVRRRRNLFFAAVAAPFLALSLGPHTPVWRFCWSHIPGLDMMRYPVKFYLPAAFALTALAGLAVDDFFVCARRREVKRPAALVATLVAAALIFAAAWGAMRRWPESILPRITPQELVRMAQENAAFARESYAELADECYAATEWSFGVSSTRLAAGAAALVAALLLARSRMPRPYGAVALALAVFLDCGFFAAHLNPLAGPEIYTEKPARLDSVPHGRSQTRVLMSPQLYSYLLTLELSRIDDLVGLANYIELVRGTRISSPEELLTWLDRTSAPRFGTPEELDNWLRTTYAPQFLTDVHFETFKETFYPNTNLLYGVPEVTSFEPLRVKWHTGLRDKAWGSALSRTRVFFIAKLWAVDTVIDRQAEPPGFAFHKLSDPGTRALLADEVISVATDNEALETIVGTEVDVTKRIILLKKDAEEAKTFVASASGQSASAGSPGTAAVVFDDGNRCVVEVDARRKAVLFLADSYFPNFRASVDGKPAPLWRANYAYRAVPVPAGRHRVEFTWRPTDLYAGVLLTVSAVAALCIIGGVSRAKARRMRQQDTRRGLVETSDRREG